MNRFVKIDVRDCFTIHKGVCGLCILILMLGLPVAAQSRDSTTAVEEADPHSMGAGYLYNYLNMAGTTKASNFRPLTQQERNNLYLKTMINPLGYIEAGLSAGINHWKNKPPEWEQGASGYGKRYADIIGQYSIQRTVTFGLSSAFHEDNRYFNSGKKGFWRRTGYALTSGLMARQDDGSRHVSVSQLGGVTASAFLSRLWQPPSHNSAGDGAVSFGITMIGNMGIGVLKEFLPDVGRVIARKHKNRNPN